jgi:hypothetical protein
MLFVHKYAEGRIILRPTDVVVDELRRKHVIQGLTVEFHNHRFITEDPELIKKFLNYPDYGHTYSAACNDQELLAWKKANGMAPNEDPSMLLKESKNPFVITAEPKPLEEFTAKATVGVAVPDGLTKDDVAAMIQDALAKSMGDILAVLNPAPVQENPAGIPVLDVNKPRKTFHCKICGKDGPEFKTGFEVGKHMKEVHPEPKKEEV